MQPHLLRARRYENDPGGMESVFTGFNFGEGRRLSWVQHAETYWETPLEMRYTDLDADAQYAVRIHTSMPTASRSIFASAPSVSSSDLGSAVRFNVSILLSRADGLRDIMVGEGPIAVRWVRRGLSWNSLPGCRHDRRTTRVVLAALDDEDVVSRVDGE